MELVLTKKFIKQAKKLAQNKPNLKPKIQQCLRDFQQNDRASIYYRKPLKGDKAPLEELQVGGDIRILVDIGSDNTIAVCEQIGTHSQLGL
jgi:mRNA-degrading endonuclease YafQ of YafQ-DinJ toxin-antitoxin module